MTTVSRRSVQSLMTWTKSEIPRGPDLRKGQGKDRHRATDREGRDQGTVAGGLGPGVGRGDPGQGTGRGRGQDRGQDQEKGAEGRDQGQDTETSGTGDPGQGKTVIVAKDQGQDLEGAVRGKGPEEGADRGRRKIDVALGHVQGRPQSGAESEADLLQLFRYRAGHAPLHRKSQSWTRG